MTLFVTGTNRALLAAVLGMALLAGCASSPTPEFEAQRVVPGDWQGASPAAAGTLIEGDWWASFNSPELNALMAQAMADSFTLQVSFERIVQARARLASSRSVLFPQLDAAYNSSRNDQWQGGERSASESDRLTIGASYEVDLWGRVSAGVRSSVAALEASEYAHLGARLSLQAELAGAYLQWLAAQDRLQYARASLTASEEVLRLIDLQFRAGSASQLELVQQQAAVATQQAAIHDLDNARHQIAYVLAVLTGQPPGGIALKGGSLADITLPGVGLEQPADLLRRRPDLRQAEQQLVAANANVDAARAALFPGLRLSANASTGSLLAGGATVTATALAASLAQPLFQGGRLRADVAASEAATREVLASYYQTVLEAVLEVENVLANLATQDRNRELEARSLALAERAYELADLRYRNGAADYLTLLDAQRSLIARRDSFVQFELSRHQSALDLYRVLGGSWWTAAQ